jgi:hypothetical protein
MDSIEHQLKLCLDKLLFVNLSNQIQRFLVFANAD